MLLAKLLQEQERLGPLSSPKPYKATAFHAYCILKGFPHKFKGKFKESSLEFPTFKVFYFIVGVLSKSQTPLLRAPFL